VMLQSGTLSAINSTFVGNSASGTASAQGGGLANGNPAATANLTNCTFVGNSADSPVNERGGAIYTLRTANLTNSTIVGNSAGDGGGIRFMDVLASGLITNSIIALNTADTGQDLSFDINPTDGGHNLLGSAPGTTDRFADGINGDIVTANP